VSLDTGESLHGLRESPRFTRGNPRHAEPDIEAIEQLFAFAVDLDGHLAEAIRTFGPWTYLVLFALSFGETILVLAPFLPGPSLLFAAGAYAGRPDSPLHAGALYLVFWFAGVVGDSTSYAIGRALGPRLRSRVGSARENLDRTVTFFDRHSGKTVLLARFVPVVRSLAPLVAGARRMGWRRFLLFDVTGGALCVAIYLFTGYFFGSVPAVRANFWLVLLTIAVASIIPAFLEWRRFRRGETRAAQEKRAQPPR
jgi:membrane-associated protein